MCDIGEETCSRACREQREARLASRRNYTYLLYLAIAILLIVFVVSAVR